MSVFNIKSGFLFRLLILLASVTLSACGGNGGDDDDNGGNNNPQYSVGGSVTGLSGTGLVLQNNNTDDLPIDSDQTFIFPSALDDGTDYSVTVMDHPVRTEQGLAPGLRRDQMSIADQGH